MINSGKEWEWMDEYIDKEYNFIIGGVDDKLESPR